MATSILNDIPGRSMEEHICCECHEVIDLPHEHYVISNKTADRSLWLYHHSDCYETAREMGRTMALRAARWDTLFGGKKQHKATEAILRQKLSQE